MQPPQVQQQQTQSTSTTLRPEFFEQYLDIYPDHDRIQRLCNSAKYGARIGFEGPENPTMCDNWPSAFEHSSAIEQFIDSNLQRGRVEGPIERDLLPADYKCSPLGAFTKARSNKVRIIHDLSHPPDLSCNDGIDRDLCRVDYTSVDHAVSILSKYSTPPLMVKCDLSSAFNSILVHPSDRHLLGFSWTGQDGVRRYYAMTVLPFGLCSAPRIFDEFTDFLEWVIQRKIAGDVIHYLDDFWACAVSYEDAMHALNTIISICREAGFEIQDSKTVYPTYILEFLGIVIDSISRTLSISEDRLSVILEELHEWLHRKYATKRELLSLIGRLMFCSKVITDGKVFIRRLIHLSKRAKRLHHKIRLTPQAMADIAWWAACIRSHNGTSWFPKEFDVWQAEIIFTDSSDLAAGICHRTAWTIFPFDQHNAWMRQMSIAWRELFAVVLAVAIHGPKISGRDLIMNIDNQAICWCVNKSKSKDPHIMNLIRALYFYTSIYHINFRAVHISTHDNWGADALSRLDLDKFRQFNPTADMCMTTAVPVLINF